MEGRLNIPPKTGNVEITYPPAPPCCSRKLGKFICNGTDLCFGGKRRCVNVCLLLVFVEGCVWEWSFLWLRGTNF